MKNLSRKPLGVRYVLYEKLIFPILHITVTKYLFSLKNGHDGPALNWRIGPILTSLPNMTPST
jgi:hypothetical protein